MHALAGAWNIARIAVWEVTHDAPVLVCVGDMLHSDFEQARQVWARDMPSLRRGRTVRSGEHVFYPLRDGGQGLVGFVHVAQPLVARTRRQETLGEQVMLQLALAMAVAPGDQEAGAPESERSPAWHQRRAELVVELDANGWNFAELGRRRGVTRQTIHNWARALGIVRPPWARRPRAV
jgi:hypothetical protein